MSALAVVCGLGLLAACVLTAVGAERWRSAVTDQEKAKRLDDIDHEIALYEFATLVVEMRKLQDACVAHEYHESHPLLKAEAKVDQALAVILRT